MKKAVPRGSHEERISTYDGIEMACVTWKDIKIVTLLSTSVGASPAFSVTRYNKLKKEKVVIPCPQIVHEYNKHMGGVGGLNGQFFGEVPHSSEVKKMVFTYIFPPT